MAATSEKPGPDLAQGISFDNLAEGLPHLGHVDGQPVLVVRQGASAFAVSAKCTHYGAPLDKGLVVGGSIRCPWHHACFRLKDGRALRGPALAPLKTYAVHISQGVVRVAPAKAESALKSVAPGPRSVSIVGGGAAGYAALCTLRQEGFEGPITLLMQERHRPYDRIKLSKGYLSGAIDADALTLVPNPASFDEQVRFEAQTSVVGLDVAAKQLHLAGGRTHSFDTLILAMGASAKRLPIDGHDLPHVCVLRTLDDAQALAKRAATSRRAVIVGASFIGLEVACALRHRDIPTTVISPDAMPLGKVLGPELSQYITDLHAQHGVVFQMNQKVQSISQTHVHFAGGGQVEADLVVLAVGVAPEIFWAKAAGLATDSGILVDASMQTSAADIYAAGDVAQVRGPGPRELAGGERIEHWAVAQRLGQRAARSILKAAASYASGAPGQDHTSRATDPSQGCSDAAAAPFFWSDHYDLKLRYVGHASPVDSTQVFGSLAGRKAAVALKSGGRIKAVVTVGDDALSLACEAALEAGDTARLQALLRQA